eukprot:1613726-Pleurochrysis_carterae.AAC.2
MGWERQTPLATLSGQVYSHAGRSRPCSVPSAVPFSKFLARSRLVRTNTLYCCQEGKQEAPRSACGSRKPLPLSVELPLRATSAVGQGREPHLGSPAASGQAFASPSAKPDTQVALARKARFVAPASQPHAAAALNSGPARIAAKDLAANESQGVGNSAGTITASAGGATRLMTASLETGCAAGATAGGTMGGMALRPLDSAYRLGARHPVLDRSSREYRVDASSLARKPSATLRSHSSTARVPERQVPADEAQSAHNAQRERQLSDATAVTQVEACAPRPRSVPPRSHSARPSPMVHNHLLASPRPVSVSARGATARGTTARAATARAGTRRQLPFADGAKGAPPPFEEADQIWDELCRAVRDM